MRKFLKSIWFPIVLFVLIEIIFFALGFYFMKWYALCEPCPPAPAYCPPCPSGHRGFEMLAVGIIPSAIISIIAYFLVKKFSK